MQRDLAISCESFETDSLLSEWRWLVPTDAKALLIGVFGDMILAAPDGSHWHLDLLEGRFHKVASNSKDFNERKQHEEYRDEWFGANWASIALEHGLTPKVDECFGWKVAPVLGGEFCLENIAVFSLSVYLPITGQLFRQLSRM